MSKTMINEIGERLVEKVLGEGFLVDVRFGQPKTAVTVNPRLLGLNKEANEMVQGFMDSFVENNRVSFIGKKNPIYRKAMNVAKAVHAKKKLLSLSSEDVFMTGSILETFASYVNQKEHEYMELRDQLVEDYDFLVSQFERKLRDEFLNNTLSTVVLEERERVIARILRGIPSKDQFGDSFTVKMKRTRIILPDEVEESEKGEIFDSIKETVDEITGKTLNGLFMTMNKLLTTYEENGEINNRNKSAIEPAAKDAKARNVFQVGFVDEVADALNGLKGLPTTTLVEELEILVSRVYAKALDLGIDDCLNTSSAALDTEYMRVIGEMENNQ